MLYEVKRKSWMESMFKIVCVYHCHVSNRCTKKYFSNSLLKAKRHHKNVSRETEKKKLYPHVLNSSLFVYVLCEKMILQHKISILVYTQKWIVVFSSNLLNIVLHKRILCSNFIALAMAHTEKRKKTNSLSQNKMKYEK